MLEIIGGPDRDRTDDLFHAMEARSQLRHRPTCCGDATLLLSPLWLNSSITGSKGKMRRFGRSKGGGPLGVIARP